MKNVFWSMILLAVLVLAVDGTSQISAQQQITGGYATASTKDKEVRAAADFAVTTLQRKDGGSIKLVSIKQAAKQVVAGINFKLCLRIKTESKKRLVGVIVYRNLQNQYELTNFKIDSCEN